MISKYVTGLLCVGAVVGCDRSRAQPAAQQGPATAPARPARERPAIVFLGTSLTAGLGLDPDQAYPALIQRKIDSAGFDYRAVNAGVSGETSAGALRRVDWLLRQRPAMLVIETGANDGLRGQNPDSSKANIQAIIDRANAASPRPRIVLVGMRALPNYGASYARRFERIYPELARANELPLVPFLLEGVAGIDSLTQADGMHPTAAGQRKMAETVWTVVEPLLKARP